jgi:protein-L-isoaspartate(D-aspartate) O-methyltransferase
MTSLPWLAVVLALGLGGCAEPVRRSELAGAKPDIATGPNDATGAPGAQRSFEREGERRRMVEEQLVRRDIRDGRVLDAMRRVPRHRFVPAAVAHAAYSDGPLPIVGAQTISQPYIVAFMSEAARIAPGERCLEVGTGSGYQAAVLAELCKETYSIEYLPEVAEFGRQNLHALGYLERAVWLRVGDGYAGWPDKAPFDAILVTAAPEKVPAPLLAQLALGGRLIIPVGEAGRQRMEVWTRRGPGDVASAFERSTEFGVSFVPFLGPNAQ